MPANGRWDLTRRLKGYISLLMNSRHPLGLKIVLLIANEVNFIVSYFAMN